MTTALGLLLHGQFSHVEVSQPRTASLAPRYLCPSHCPTHCSTTAVALLRHGDALSGQGHPLNATCEGTGPYVPRGLPWGCPKLHLCCRRCRQVVHTHTHTHTQHLWLSLLVPQETGMNLTSSLP